MQSRPKGVVVIAALAAAAVLGSTTYLQGYVTMGHAWGSNTVPYYVNPNNKWVSQAAAISAVQTAAAGWHDQTNANIQLVYAGQTNGSSLTLNYKNEVFFRDTASSAGNVAETWYWWDGSGKLVDADIVFYEGAYHFYAGSGCTDGIYIENVGMHEFGHALGMKHSELMGVTMQAAMTSYCDMTQVTLEADDIAGIESIYRPSSGGGTTPTNTAPSVTITAPGNNSSYSDTTTIGFSGTADDSQDGNLNGNLRWTSSLQGQIGTGPSFSRTLSAGTHTITASAVDSGGMSGSRQVSLVITVTATATTPPTSGATLTVRGYKVRGVPKVDLAWTGLTATTIDVYRNGARVASANGSSYTDSIDKKGGGTYTYKVCAAGTSTCTNNASAIF